VRDKLVRDRAHRPELDGLRGLAILLVLGQHAPTRPLIDGFVGVTVFFCLSGFLITTLLVRQLETGTIDVRTFYRRRAARLYPALATVVAATTVVLLTARRDLGVGQIFAPAGAAITYTTSLFDWTNHAFATKDYFNYTWSLSVEEQFYLLWPFALLWGYRRNPRLFAVLTLSIIGVTVALDLYLALSRAVKYDQHEYFGSDANALPILVGSLLAIIVVNGWLSGTVRLLAPWALLAVALLPVLAYRNDTYRPSMVIVAGTGLTLVTLIGVVTRPRSTAGSLLASRPMRWLGERSYSIYLWNVLARIAMLTLLGHTVVGDIAWIAMFVTLAEVSFRFVERPLRARFARTTPLATGGPSRHVGRGLSRRRSTVRSSVGNPHGRSAGFALSTHSAPGTVAIGHAQTAARNDESHHVALVVDLVLDVAGNVSPLAGEEEGPARVVAGRSSDSGRGF
jgi:peptidoglycan/LPS O-acetylase OafA/YrhL